VGKKNILIIEDMGALRHLYSQYLRKAGFNPIVQDSGEGGLKKAMALKPELILLDIGLPGMDGMEVCRRLKSSHQTKDIPIVMVSGGKALEKDVIECIETGAIHYVLKPVNFEHLINLINGILKGDAITTPTMGQKKKTILIVDDHGALRNILSFELEKNGFKTLMAENGERGLQIATFQKPELILLDVMMPKINGFEICRRLKKKTQTKGIPIMMLTAKSQRKDVLEGFQAGAINYIVKPCKFDKLYKKIVDLIGQPT